MVEKSHTAGWWPNLYEPLRNVGSRIADWFAPASEAASMENAYEISMELPGVKPDDIDVSVHDNTLTVKGEKRTEREEKGKSYFFSERQYGAFQRSFRLPSDADAAAVDASHADGVLTIRIGRKSAKQKGSRIEVRAG